MRECSSPWQQRASTPIYTEWSSPVPGIRGQSPLLLESRSTILGVLPDAVDTTPSLELQLEPGDRIVLYTDGITEVFNSREEMLGIEGIREIVRQTAALPSDEMKQGILDGVAAWRSGPPSDDVSLVLVHVR